jgi:hypothetical protein
MELWGSSTEFFAFRANLYRLSGFYFEILLLKAGLNYPGWWTENILHLYVLTVCNKNQHINFWKQNFWPLYKKPFRPITPSLGFSFVIISRSESFFIYFAGFALQFSIINRLHYSCHRDSQETRNGKESTEFPFYDPYELFFKFYVIRYRSF